MDKMNQQFRFLLTSLAGIQFSEDVVLSYYTPGYLHKVRNFH
jgi:hypothetical protein